MSKRTVSIDSAVFDNIGRAVRRWRDQNADQDPVVCGHDPGALTGWCLLDWSGFMQSGDGSPARAAQDARKALNGRRPVLYVREAPFTVTKKQMADSDERHSNPAALFKMGLAAGIFSGALLSELADAVLWEPLPMQHRAVVGLNRKATPGRSSRDETADVCVLWSEATYRISLSTAGGRKRIDEAMAIVMATAGMSILKAAECAE